MKKLFCAFVCVVFSVSAIAGNKKEKVAYYGPEQNSFAISFSAVPVVNFVGNMFNGTTKQTFGEIGGSSFAGFDGTTLDVKYYVSDRVGLTAGVGFNCLTSTSFRYEHGSNEVLEGTAKSSQNDLMFTFGFQYLMRPGCRLQPVLGARLMCMSGNNVRKTDDLKDSQNDSKYGDPSFAFGAIGDLGVEYFLSKNVSFSAVANLGVYKETNKEKVKSNSDDYVKKTSASSRFATGNLGGNIAFNFYF